MSDKNEFECRECGSSYAFEGERIICRGGEERHREVEVVRPCGICGDPITMAEICKECGDESDTDAFTPTWG